MERVAKNIKQTLDIRIALAGGQVSSILVQAPLWHRPYLHFLVLFGTDLYYIKC